MTQKTQTIREGDFVEFIEDPWRRGTVVGVEVNTAGEQYVVFRTVRGAWRGAVPRDLRVVEDRSSRPSAQSEACAALLEGRRLIAQCKRRLLTVMRSMSSCAPDGVGARSSDLEDLAGFSLDLPAPDCRFTWSLLRSLEKEGRVQVLQKGPRTRRYYRLTEKA